MLYKLLMFSVMTTNTFAHTAMMSCFDNGDDTIICEGGFSDGSSASGILIYIKVRGKKIIEGHMNEDSEFSFKNPKDDFVVHFDAGEGHRVAISGDDIVE